MFEPADVAARVGGELRELGLKFGATKRKGGHFRRLAGGHFAEGGQGGDPFLEGGRQTVVAGSDGRPLGAVEGGLDAITGGDAVLELGIGGAAVAAPDDPADLGLCFEFQLRPAGAFLGGDPTAGIAVLAIVEEAGLVDAVAVGVKARDGHLGAQGDVLAGQIEDLEFVDACLGGGGGDGEAHEFRFDRREVLLIGEVGHRSAEMRDGQFGAFRDRFEGRDVGGGGAALVAGSQDEHALRGDAVYAHRLQSAPAALIRHRR